MSDAGYGSPSSASVDWGFGSPTPASWDVTGLDTGHGSPTPPTAWVMLVESATVIGHAGGDRITIHGYPLPSAGPFTVRLVPVVPGPIVPLTDNCYSGTIGRRDLCDADGTLETFVFVSPPATEGLYTIRVTWPLGTLDIVGALRVVRRHYSPATYRLRNALPPYYPAGPRSIGGEV